MRELGATRDVDQVLQLSVDLATELIRGCDLADVMFSRDGHTTVPASTDPVSLQLAKAQEEAGGGPCLSVFNGDESVIVNDLQADGRWPGFAGAAEEFGVRSAMAHRLFVDQNGEDRFGALNLYGRDGAFDDASRELAGVFAAFCSTALHGAIQEEGLRRALASRDIIGQAKGVLMAQHGITPEDAYELIKRRSQETNTKVVDIAEQITATGQLS